MLIYTTKEQIIRTKYLKLYFGTRTDYPYVVGIRFVIYKTYVTHFLYQKILFIGLHLQGNVSMPGSYSLAPPSKSRSEED